MIRLAIGALFAPVALASPDCLPCHRQQVDLHAATGHASALRPVAQHPLRHRFARAASWQSGPYRFAVEPSPTGFEFDVQADQWLRLPAQWAFGAGQQAVTFVSQASPEAYVEFAYSYYTALGTFALTPGHAERKPASAAEASGLLYPILDPKSGILGCFECHSTGKVAVGPGNRLEPATPGVQCLACHPGAITHRAKPGKLPSLARLRRPAPQLDACGRCHRPPAQPGESIDWNYPWNVRHQPVYLAESRCYRESRTLTCTTCHPAHQSVRDTSLAAYNTRCANCHERCPSNPPGSNCVDCHMPQVSPQSGLRFSNHWIGIYRPGQFLRPSARPNRR